MPVGPSGRPAGYPSHTGCDPGNARGIGYPSRVTLLFRRQSASAAQAVEVETPAEVKSAVPRALTAKKGEATPKRPSANRRVAVSVPTDKKAAAAQSRDRQRTAREESRRGMMAGEERYLLAKDKGPIRRLARDAVDSRFNVATVLFFGLFGVLAFSTGVFPQLVRSIANGMLIFLILATLADTYLTVRRVRGLVAKRLPKESQGARGLFFYVLMRSISIRRLRIPKPQVRVGQEI